jgi:uncharacterized membrane protein (UPF0136 family)
MKTSATNRVSLLAGLTLGLLFSASGTLHADGESHPVPKKTAVTGKFD